MDSHDIVLRATSYQLVRRMSRKGFTGFFYGRIFHVSPEFSALFEPMSVERREMLIYSLLDLAMEFDDHIDYVTCVLRLPSWGSLLNDLQPAHLMQYTDVLRESIADFVGEAWTTEMDQLWEHLLTQVVTCLTQVKS